MNKLAKLGLIFIALCLAVAANWYYSPTQEEEHLHYHAGFRVYIDDNLQNYSGYQFMNYSPCSEHDMKKSKAEEQIEKAHLHDSVGDVVHVHRGGAVWGDLFKNIKVDFPNDKPMVGYIDGEKIENILEAPIVSYTSAIFVIGSQASSHIEESVSREHIQQVEAKSELCGV